jgi:hypothetical protein
LGCFFFLRFLSVGFGAVGRALARDCKEAFSSVNNQPVRSRWVGRVKWIIWMPWILGITVAGISAGGLRQVDPFFSTVGGVNRRG